MKVVKGILYFLAIILVLFTILIVASAYNPNITSNIQKVLFKNKNVTVSESEENMESSDEVVRPATDSTEEDGSDVPPEEFKMRTLEEAGISEDSLITSLEDYYTNCHNQIIEKGIGEYSFENVISTESLVQEIYAKYSDKSYIDEYMNDTLNEIGAATYEMNLLVEELEGENFRLTHQMIIKD